MELIEEAYALGYEQGKRDGLLQVMVAIGNALTVKDNARVLRTRRLRGY